MTTNPAPRVFIVEDESMLVMLLEDLLPTLGYAVVGSAASVDQALAALDQAEADLAVIDVNLAGEPSFPVADALRARGVPFLFTTGYGQQGLPARFADAAVLAKPFRRQDIQDALAGLHPAA
ncbi:response regulator [Pseudoxanthomonas sp. F37]|jgi:CheY-like chemotaxis protein|uniref:response regulator n=1 Tax=Pseudoxanthomonas TaxID=83618 RepID=UPI001FD53AB3|nr:MULTISPECIES: response regulator [Pseudoxanthomonas]UOV06102.1 response regulator [Pseudoxanthomonas mexicana]UOV07690.1 response regulator [Pseudoxanthomonas sp. F37]